MATTTPNQLRSNILAARGEIQAVQQLLMAHEKDTTLGLGSECVRVANSLGELLALHSVPNEYRVAIVGRFKAGKSFFVNELLGRKLAGEETNPETAAVTTFRHGDGVRARLHFLPAEQWQALKQLHQENPKDPDVQRITNWFKFPTRKADDDAKEHYDEAKLLELERQYIVPAGRYVDLALGNPDDKKAGQEFRKTLKQFTTGTRPHHCLVEKIEITAPCSLLEQGVLLIDTPGLDDPERFRVALTQDVLKDVDAVLFLTKSGASYGQTEKDFVLSLLRRDAIKQLVFVVTQVDHTYSQHVDQAEGDDEPVEPIARRIEQERRRLRKQIDDTLTELAEGGEDTPAMERYREHLGEVEIFFTSAINHRKAKDKKAIEYPLSELDPGGMDYVQHKLMEILSTESRLARVARTIRSAASVELKQLLRLIEARRVAVHSVQNKEVAQQKLERFRMDFATAGSAFADKVHADVAVLRRAIESDERLAVARIETIALAADKLLGEFETDDAGRHWRTRRSGRWGYMFGLQTKVANGIFPRVAQLLNEQQVEFSSFVEKFKAHLTALAEDSAQISQRLDVGAGIRIDAAARLEEFLNRSLAAMQELIDAEEARIIQLLDDFVTEEVEERISAARGSVAGVFGTGTTIHQTSLVREFYGTVRDILRKALEDHLRARNQEHGAILTSKAEQLPDKALAEVTVELDRIAADITAAAEAAASGQKVAFDGAAARLSSSLQHVLNTMGGLFASEPDVPPDRNTVAAFDQTPVPQLAAVVEALATSSDEVLQVAVEIDWERVQADALHQVKAIPLQPNDVNWGWGRIFEKPLIQGVTSAMLIDPYLDKRHQRRNLGEVIEHLRSNGSLRRIDVVTGKRGDPDDAEGDQQLRELAAQLQQVGVELNWTRDSQQHDRRLLLNNGVVFELGMGLDIYGPTRNLSESNPSLRRIRKATRISVLKPAR
jgi:signal recognition particle receptor subunit beta